MVGRNGAETRRSGRVTLRVPLRIYEPGSNNRFLVEEAYSVKVSLCAFCRAAGRAAIVKAAKNRWAKVRKQAKRAVS